MTRNNSLCDSADNISFESRKSLIVKCLQAETVAKLWTNFTENERLRWYSRRLFNFFSHLLNFMLLCDVAEFSFKPFHHWNLVRGTYVTIQMKPLLKYFLVVLFVVFFLEFLLNKICNFFFLILTLAASGVEKAYGGKTLCVSISNIETSSLIHTLKPK